MKKFIILIFMFLLFFSYRYLSKTLELSQNSNFIEIVLKLSNYHFNSKKVDYNLGGIININEPVSILETSLAYRYKKSYSYMENNKFPQVYIYNTHPTEMYAPDHTNLDFGVLSATNLLKDKLDERGIAAIVEEKSTADYIKDNNKTYNESYEGSREFIIEVLKEYPNLDLIIDLHRDAIDKDVTTVNKDGLNYAKVMFVQNKSCDANISLAQAMSDKMGELSRGLYTKHNHKFNQDLNPNIILLELGGNYNKMEEVVNTIDVLADAIEETINERKS